VVGELHPRWRQSYGFAQAPVLFELDLDAVLQRKVPAPVAVPKHQDVERDLAVVVQETVTHQQLVDAVRSVHDSLLQQVTVFDIYRPKPGKDGGGGPASMAETEKSVALRLVFNGGDEALDEKRIDASTQAVLHALEQRTAARLRA